MSSTARPKKENLSILVTAGPTREKIDPVRFISNYSTGTFGYSIAREAVRRGHRVVLVSGPTALKPPLGARFIAVETALEMRRAVSSEYKEADCVIMAAAVSDWRPVFSSKRKLKRAKHGLKVEFVTNPDILAELGKRKKNKILVGFAVETEGLEKNAFNKLKEKNLDLIIASRLTRKKDVFGDKRVDVLMIDSSEKKTILSRRAKRELAKIILDKISSLKI